VAPSLYIDGLYYHHLQRWLEFFPAKNILVINDDDLLSKTLEVLARVWSFLELPQIELNEADIQMFNVASSGYLHLLSFAFIFTINKLKKKKIEWLPTDTQKMWPSEVEYIRQYYSKHNEALAKFLEDDRIMEWKDRYRCTNKTCRM